MTWPLVKLVWQRFPADPPMVRDVLLALADQARSEDGSDCYPALSTIAFHAGCKEAQARRCVRELQRLGFVQVLDEGKGGNPTRGRHYRIVVAALENLETRGDALKRLRATPSAHARGKEAPTPTINRRGNATVTPFPNGRGKDRPLLSFVEATPVIGAFVPLPSTTPEPLSTKPLKANQPPPPPAGESPPRAVVIDPDHDFFTASNWKWANDAIRQLGVDPDSIFDLYGRLERETQELRMQAANSNQQERDWNAYWRDRIMSAVLRPVCRRQRYKANRTERKRAERLARR